MRCYVLMGVSGCGKSTVGRAVSTLCGMTFIDGDDLHPASNIKKMSRGLALSDADRSPWLKTVGDRLADTRGAVVVGCSALKRSYRDIIRARVPEPVPFVHLDGTESVLAARVSERAGHFMPLALLRSQFETLEGLSEEEFGLRIDIDQPLNGVIEQTARYIRETMT